MNTDKVDASVFIRAHPWLKNQTRVFWRAVQSGWATGLQRMDDLRPPLRGRQEGEGLLLGWWRVVHESKDIPSYGI